MRTKRIDYISYIISYILCFLFSKTEHPYISGSILIIEAVLLYILNYRRSGQLADLKGLFSLSWIAGEGLACLKLSNLQSEWENVTWICFFLAYFCFIAAFDIAEKHVKKTAEKDVARNERQAKRLLICIVFLEAASVAGFLIEAAVCGFIPLFSPEPHAYSYFHVSGVHYFTISCILIPAMTVLYSKLVERITWKRLVVLVLGNTLAAAIPILCVSRFQLLFAVGFAAVLYLLLYRKITWKMVVGALIVMIPAYVLLTVARRHDVSYLNDIFDMKNRNTPIFITQPYMYVVNNYENFNCLVQQLPAYTRGIRMLFPFFALTGLKFVFPQVASTPIYTTKEELTTLTMFYDAYYDFGVVGVILLAAVLGAVSAKLTTWVKESNNPVSYLFYGQIAIYLALSFFTTWFSNATTWFWLILTFGMYLFVGYDKKENRRMMKG